MQRQSFPDYLPVSSPLKTELISSAVWQKGKNTEKE